MSMSGVGPQQGGLSNCSHLFGAFWNVLFKDAAPSWQCNDRTAHSLKLRLRVAYMGHLPPPPTKR